MSINYNILILILYSAANITNQTCWLMARTNDTYLYTSYSNYSKSNF